MVTRRSWFKRGAAVVIGGATVVVGGEPMAASPAAEPLSAEGCFTFVLARGPIRSVAAEFHFAEDGSFRIEPYTFGRDGGPVVYGEPIVSGPNATARDLFEALVAAAER